jgi:hypothetical protein
MNEELFPRDLAALSLVNRVTGLGDFSPTYILVDDFLGQGFEKNRSSPNFLAPFYTIKCSLGKKCIGLHFGRFFSQTHPGSML